MTFISTRVLALIIRKFYVISVFLNGRGFGTMMRQQTVGSSNRYLEYTDHVSNNEVLGENGKNVNL